MFESQQIITFDQENGGSKIKVVYGTWWYCGTSRLFWASWVFKPALD
jgi:predicted branched-subunit amino acid permease